MATTTEWEWINISRAKDFTYVNGQPLFRENWSLTRRRTSTADYSSELGSSATSLTAYNGGIAETVTVPTYAALTFGTTRVWVAAGVLWVPTGFNRNGYASYVCVEPSKTDNTKQLVLFYGNSTSALSGSYWMVVEASPSDVSSGTWSNDSSANHARSATFLGSYVGYSGSWAAGSPASTLSSTTTNATFYCTGDVQSYQVGGIPWYDQNQTWQSKTPWAS